VSNQNARQDDNQFPALIVHSGTAGTAETRRLVGDSSGNLGVTSLSTPLAVCIDGTQTTNVTYIGKAAVGAMATANVWQVFKINEAGGTLGDAVISYADGDSNFDNPWTGRATASYS
jgi:hypothetical protein